MIGPSVDLDKRAGWDKLWLLPIGWEQGTDTVSRLMGGIVTRRHVRSQQEWHCLPRWEPTVKDRC
jgi:hypothetical protein